MCIENQNVDISHIDGREAGPHVRHVQLELPTFVRHGRRRRRVAAPRPRPRARHILSGM